MACAATRTIGCSRRRASTSREPHLSLIVRLYHTTTPENAESIRREGFRDGVLHAESGPLYGVHLSYQPDQVLPRPDITFVLEVEDTVVARWHDRYPDEDLGHLYVPAKE